MFYNITLIEDHPNGNPIVREAQFFVSEEFGKRFYDSCAETRFGASNTLAMTFIGGGADNYADFLKYLGIF